MFRGKPGWSRRSAIWASRRCRRCGRSPNAARRKPAWRPSAALGRLGDGSSAAVLLDVATGTAGELSQAAIAVLADLPGKELDTALAARLPNARGQTRAVLVRLVGQRHAQRFVPALLQAADDPDAQVRTAALEALGATISLGDLPLLIARTARPQSPAEAAAAQTALSAACVRMPDREACAERLAAALPEAAAPVKQKLLAILGAVGGKNALAAIAAATKDPDPKMQDMATHLLGQWMSADAAGVLLDLAKSSADAKLQSRPAGLSPHCPATDAQGPHAQGHVPPGRDPLPTRRGSQTGDRGRAGQSVRGVVRLGDALLGPARPGP